MTFGTGPQALRDYLDANWKVSRDFRPDIPDSTTEQRSAPGTVFITNDRGEIANNQNVHDLVHCYHPEAGGIEVDDKGSQEQGTIEPVRIDVETADRTDPDTGERVNARDALVGDRGELTVPFTVPHHVGLPSYPGIAGEVKYLLELIRKGHEEWQRVAHDGQAVHLGNSNARFQFRVELEIIAVNTADATA